MKKTIIALVFIGLIYSGSAFAMTPTETQVEILKIRIKILELQIQRLVLLLEETTNKAENAVVEELSVEVEAEEKQSKIVNEEKKVERIIKPVYCDPRKNAGGGRPCPAQE